MAWTCCCCWISLRAFKSQFCNCSQICWKAINLDHLNLIKSLKTKIYYVRQAPADSSMDFGKLQIFAQQLAASKVRGKIFFAALTCSDLFVYYRIWKSFDSFYKRHNMAIKFAFHSFLKWIGTWNRHLSRKILILNIWNEDAKKLYFLITFNHEREVKVKR